VSPARNHFALWTGVKVVVAAVLVFILARIAIPDLVNAHNTALLIVAIVLGVVTLGIVIWTVISIRQSYRRLHSASIHLIEADRK
jgi:hypothetical protein